mgnify:FL=1|jgi:hypothetical protein
MSTEFKFQHLAPEKTFQGKVKVTDLIHRLNQEKKVEKKRNLALGFAAVSAVTVFGIILTI